MFGCQQCLSLTLPPFPLATNWANGQESPSFSYAKGKSEGTFKLQPLHRDLDSRPQSLIKTKSTCLCLSHCGLAWTTL